MAATPQDTEQALLRGLASWDAAWAQQDAEALRKVLAPDVVLHAGTSKTCISGFATACN